MGKVTIAIASSDAFDLERQLKELADKYERQRKLWDEILIGGVKSGVEIEIDTDNAAFHEGVYDRDADWEEVRATEFLPYMEVCRILREIAGRIGSHQDDCTERSVSQMSDRKLMDVNGNAVGYLKIVRS